MAIYAVTGKPGSGKTYFLARCIAKWIMQGKRIYPNFFIDLKSEVFRPYYKQICPEEMLEYSDKKKGERFMEEMARRLTGEFNEEDINNEEKQIFPWRNMTDWNKMTKGIIVADEGTRYFNPRKWSSLSEETEAKLMQHRHEDLDIWLSVQHYTRLDVTLRILVERFLDVEKTFAPKFLEKKPYAKLTITEHYLEDMERMERMNRADREAEAIDKETVWIVPKYANIYNTRQMVGRSEPMKLRHEIRWCEDPMCPQHGQKHPDAKPKIIHS